MISRDPKLLEQKSAVTKRTLEYGQLFSNLNIILLIKNVGTTNRIKVADNIFIYPVNLSFFSYIFLPIQFFKVVSSLSYKVDVVTAQDFESGFISWLVSKKIKAKLQIQVHTDFLSPYFRKQFWLNYPRVILAKFILKRADSIRVVSERIKQSIVKNIKVKKEPVVLPIFVDHGFIKRYQPKFDLHKKYPQFEFIILMMSRLTNEKNIGLAIEVLVKLWKDKVSAGLVIVGDGPEKNHLVSLVKKFNLDGKVIFEKWTEDPISYYKTADLFLVTSNYEGYGLTIVEALASGLPVMSTDVGVANEVGASLADPNVGDFYNKTKSLLLGHAKNINFKAQTLSKQEYLKMFKETIESCLR